MAGGGHVHAVDPPQPPIVVLAETPVVHQFGTVVLRHFAEQLVVNGSAPADAGEDFGGTGVKAGKHQDACACGRQRGEPVGVPPHHGVNVHFGAEDVIDTGIDSDKCGIHGHSGSNLLAQDLVHFLAANGEIGITPGLFRVGQRELFGRPVRPTANLVGSCGVGVAQTFGKRIAQCHIPC